MLLSSTHFEHAGAKSTTRVLILVLALVLIDQVTKNVALLTLPVAQEIARASAFSFGLGWHIHQPEGFPVALTILSFALAAVWWVLPVPMFVRIAFTAAALSNHVEKLVRPGTVDFIVINIAGKSWVANVADAYVLLAIVVLIATVAKRISVAKSWTEAY